MRSFTERAYISAPREAVFDFVADMAWRPAWCGHSLEDFRLARVKSDGLGAAASFLLEPPLFKWRAESSIVVCDRPRRIVEELRVGRVGRSRAFAEYHFARAYQQTELELVIWTEPGHPWDAVRESFGARSWLRRRVRKALDRLRRVFEEPSSKPLPRATIAGYEPLKAARFGV